MLLLQETGLCPICGKKIFEIRTSLKTGEGEVFVGHIYNYMRVKVNWITHGNPLCDYVPPVLAQKEA